MPRRHRFESATVQYLVDRFVGTDPKRRDAFDRALLDAEVAMALYRLRTRARLTQAQLARRVGTSASVISRLEDGDYRGHSMSMLRRVAEALDHRVEIRFVKLSHPSRRPPRRPRMRRHPRAA